MDAKISEGLFASYLDKCGMAYQRHFSVHGEKNVDFRIESPEVLLCDVKEVRDSEKKELPEEIDAYKHIRGDLNDLRKKFKSNKPTVPVVLVTMNFSSNFFTGFTVVRAMLGDVGVELNAGDSGEARHLPRGNASLTKSTNTCISGIFVYDCVCDNHAYYSNPFAKNRAPINFFPGVAEFKVKRDAGALEIFQKSNLMYWGYESDDNPKK